MISAGNGKEIFSASLGKVFYLDDDKEISEDFLTQNERRKRSPLIFSASISGNYFDLIGDYEINTDENQSNRGFLGIRYSPSDSSSFNINYAMNSDNPHKDKDRYENEEIDLAFSIRLLSLIHI